MDAVCRFEMSEADILKEYREAKCPAKQIKILAELNLVSVKVMREFIARNVGNVPRAAGRKSRAVLWTRENVEAIRRMAGQQMYDVDIAKELGLGVKTVKNIRSAYGIPVGRYAKRKRAQHEH